MIAGNEDGDSIRIHGVFGELGLLLDGGIGVSIACQSKDQRRCLVIIVALRNIDGIFATITLRRLVNSCPAQMERRELTSVVSNVKGPLVLPTFQSLSSFEPHPEEVFVAGAAIGVGTVKLRREPADVVVEDDLAEATLSARESAPRMRQRAATIGSTLKPQSRRCKRVTDE